MKHFLLLIVQCALILILSGVSHADTYKHDPTGICFPEELAGMTRGKIRDLETDFPGYGLSVGYSAPRINATIYIYNLERDEIKDGAGTDFINLYFMQLIEDIYAIEERGFYSSVNKLSESVTFLGTGDDSQQFLKASFEYVQQKVKRRSYMYLTGSRNHFFKIRYTYHASAIADAEKMLQSFEKETANLLSVKKQQNEIKGAVSKNDKPFKK